MKYIITYLNDILNECLTHTTKSEHLLYISGKYIHFDVEYDLKHKRTLFRRLGRIICVSLLYERCMSIV